MEISFWNLGFEMKKLGLVEREEKKTENFEIMRDYGWLGGVMVS